MSKLCDHCVCEPDDDPHDPSGPEGCPIIAYAMAFDVDDEKYPKEWVYGPDGAPTCTAFIRRQAGDDRVLDPYAVAAAKAKYDALPRDPVTGRPVI